MSADLPFRFAQVGIYLAILWAVHLTGVYTIMGSDGVVPGETEAGLFSDIIAAAFLHGGDWHIASNTGAMIPLLIALAMVDRQPGLTIVVLIIGAGMGLYFLGPVGSGPHIGASDLLCALVWYLIVFGIKSGNVLSIIIAVGVGLYFGASTLAAVEPGQASSWEGHLAGVVVGLLWGAVNPIKPG